MSVERALAFVAWRTVLRRLSGAIGSPAARVASALALLGAVGAHAWLLAQQATTAAPVAPLHVFGRGLLVVLAIVSVTATLGCPVRLSSADVAWVLPTPSAPRRLLRWKLAVAAGRALPLGTISGAVALLAAGAAPWPAWRTGVALAAIALLVRSTSFVVYLATVHGVPRVLVRIGAPAVLVASALAGGPLAALTDVLAAGATGAAGAGPTLAAAGAVLVLAAVVVAWGTGYSDEAARQAWELDSVQAAVRRGGAGLDELAARSVRRDVPTWQRGRRLRREWAFTWRALADARRRWRTIAAYVLVAAALAAAAAVWRPALAPLPAAALVVFGALASPNEGLGEELGRSWVRAVPARPARLLLAVSALPWAVNTLLLTAAWLPVVATPLDPALRWGGLLAAPAAVAAVVAAGALAAVHATSAVVRSALAAACVALWLAVTAAAALAAPGPLAGLAAALATTAATTALALTVTARRAAQPA